jgi:short-subunit dehydrogenase
MVLQRKRLAEKTWVITGAAHGIGLEMTKQVAKQNGRVFALDVDQEALNELQVLAKREGLSIETMAVNVCDELAMASTIEQIRARARSIDVWVNNAGCQKVGAFSMQKKDDFDAVMRLNFDAVVKNSRLILTVFDEQGFGVILNMASVAGHVPAPFMTAYVASKYAVVGFTRALQAELHLLKSPVHVAFASPGFVNTKIIAKGQESGFPDWLSWMVSDVADCAKDIIHGVMAGDMEIYPTMSGFFMRKAYAWMPQATVKSSRLLLTKGIKDLVLNRYQIPR